MAELAKVKTWLEAINEGQQYDTFVANKVDTLLACGNLTDKDLDKLGITGAAERKNIILNSQLLRTQPDYFTKLKAEAEKKLAASKAGGQIGKKGTQRFLTMARADLSAYNYLSSQYEARQWIEQSIGEKLDDDFWVATADGTALCRLANQIWPGCIPRYHPADSYKYKLLDNIGFFLKVASDRLKVSVDILFSPIDLFEKKNMPKVVKALQLIAEHATKNGFAVQWRNEQDLEFTPKQIQEAKKLEGLNDKNPIPPVASKAKVETTAPPQKSFISQAEEQKRAEAQLKKSEDQDKASRTLRLRQKEQEELLAALRREEEEDRKRKEEAEAKQKRELEELERARLSKQKEVEQELIKQRQEEEKKRIEAEEKAEAERAVKYGGKANLQVIRTVIDALRNKLSNDDGDTMLHLAVRSGNPEVVRFVIEETGANVNKPNFNQDTALHQAAKLGNEAVVAVLLKAGANVNVLNRDGDYALHHAAIAGHTGVVQLLVKAGAEIDARNLRLETPLILAVRHSNLEVVDALIKAGADVNAFSKDEETCLHMAAKKGNVDLINKLNNSFNFKLDLNPRNRENATPLQVAAEDQYLEAVKRLVELGADLHTKRNDGWDPLYTAAYNGDLKTAVFLLSKGADINGVDEEGWSPLHAACAQGHIDIVKSFMEDFNAKANVINENGTTPLFHAVSAGRRTIAQYLLDKGADINLSGPHAWKPIHAATYNEFKKLTELLTERGANLSSQCRDIKNYSPLHILISTDKPPQELVELLIKKKAPLDIQHESGGTPLHLAAFWGHEAVTKLLLEAGAKTEIKNDKGRTALDVAALYGHRGVAEMIAKKSGQPMPKLKEKKKKTTSMKAPAEPPAPEQSAKKN